MAAANIESITLQDELSEKIIQAIAIKQQQVAEETKSSDAAERAKAELLYGLFLYQQDHRCIHVTRANELRSFFQQNSLKPEFQSVLTNILDKYIQTKDKYQQYCFDLVPIDPEKYIGFVPRTDHITNTSYINETQFNQDIDQYFAKQKPL